MLMRKNRVGAVLIISVVMAIIRTSIIVLTMEKNNYETDTYYLPDQISVTIFTIASILFLAIFAIFAFIFGFRKTLEVDCTGNNVVASSCMLGFLFLGAVVIFVVNYLSDRNSIETVEIVKMAFALLSGIGFIVVGLKVCHKKTLAFLSLFPLGFSIFRLLGDFMKTGASPLASSGSYHIMGLVAVMLYFLSEGKALVGKTSAVLYHLYGYFSMFLLMVYSLPNLIIHCVGVFCFDYFSALSAVDVVIVIYIATKLAGVKVISEKKDALENIPLEA